MLLLEIFNKPEKWQVKEDNDYGFIAKFAIDDKQYEFVAEQEDEDQYVVDFFLMGKSWPTTELTNTGDSLQVFATIVHIFKTFLTKRKPKIIEFSAKENSRIKLYDRMAKLLNAAGYSSVDAPQSTSAKNYKFVRG